MQSFPPLRFANQRTYILLSVFSTPESMQHFLCFPTSFGLIFLLDFENDGRESDIKSVHYSFSSKQKLARKSSKWPLSLVSEKEIAYFFKLNAKKWSLQNSFLNFLILWLVIDGCHHEVTPE